MKFIVVALLAALSSGCALTPTKAAKHMDVVLQQCRSEHRTGTHVQYIKCVNEGRSKFYLDNNYPYMDLNFLLNAKSLAIAEDLDQGVITKAQANVLAAELLLRITTEENKRNADAAHAAASRAHSIETWGRIGENIGRGFDNNAGSRGFSCFTDHVSNTTYTNCY